MVTNLSNMNGKMQEGAAILTSAIRNIITMTSQVTSNVTEAASAVTQMVTTAEETKHTAHLVGQRAKEISTNAQYTAEISQLGQDAVEKALAGMQHIRQQMESIAHSIVQLSEQSQTISTIINSVNELTEQSNLLAINAEIEAAKAGEKGKGFGVVAQEVKSLAAQSKSATAKIRLLLNDIHSAVQTAVHVTAQGTQAVDAGVKQSLDAGESIRALSQNINDAVLAMSQIVSSSQQQALGMDQVVLAIASIRQATAQNTDGIQRIDREAQHLYIVGQTLKELTERYVI
jgi:methyl-accepting chemotaxis protein